MSDNSSYILTNHVRERLQERFNNTFDIEWDKVSQVDGLLNSLLADSYSDCSYINNSYFMYHLYDKYGYDKQYEFLVNAKHKVVFVINIISENGVTSKLVKTCFPAENLFGIRTKFKKQLRPTKHKNHTMNRAQKWDRLDAEIREEVMFGEHNDY